MSALWVVFEVTTSIAWIVGFTGNDDTNVCVAAISGNEGNDVIAAHRNWSTFSYALGRFGVDSLAPLLGDISAVLVSLPFALRLGYFMALFLGYISACLIRHILAASVGHFPGPGLLDLSALCFRDLPTGGRVLLPHLVTTLDDPMAVACSGQHVSALILLILLRHISEQIITDLFGFCFTNLHVDSTAFLSLVRVASLAVFFITNTVCIGSAYDIFLLQLNNCFDIFDDDPATLWQILLASVVSS